MKDEDYNIYNKTLLELLKNHFSDTLIEFDKFLLKHVYNNNKSKEYYKKKNENLNVLLNLFKDVPTSSFIEKIPNKEVFDYFIKLNKNNLEMENLTNFDRIQIIMINLDLEITGGIGVEFNINTVFTFWDYVNTVIKDLEMQIMENNKNIDSS
ncbi:hypothetical protein A0H76_2832 [Hepatospora eriocheir]|uniref:Uncharacterized protein n=1 Tax=Hepatospora eriocheir TaxID=1081669 RepID=A0A1X0QLA5_9MICR|nr:hypothetical protein A0H76_2832 [Hepatospora eriocheir]